MKKEKNFFSKKTLLSIFNDNFYFSGKDFFVKNIVIDSRKVKKGSLFIAIKGEKNDGHFFIKQSIERGAVCIICEYIPDDIKEYIKHIKINYILVKNSIQALTKLAIFYRLQLKAKVIGITGNIGKTSTKEMIKTVLSGFYKTFANFGNYNNNIGLPLTIVNTPLDTEILILEMGMNHIGEIEFLTKIAKPDIAIITKISPVHIGNFKNIDEIVAGKSEIFLGMNKKNGIVILNKSDKYYSKLVEFAKQNKIKNIISISDFDHKEADFFVSDFKFCKNFTTKYNIHNKTQIIPCKIHGFSLHNAVYSLFSFAVAGIFGIKLKNIVKQMANNKIVEGRGNLIKLAINVNNDFDINGKKTKEKNFFEKKNITIINDAYNSSPEALKTSIRTLSMLAEVKKKQNIKNRAVAIIGDMLELGKMSKKYHKEIADVLIENKIKNMITIGDETKIIYDILQQQKKVKKINLNEHYNSTDEFIRKIYNLIKDGDLILLKGSHGMHLEKIIEELKLHA